MLQRDQLKLIRRGITLVRKDDTHGNVIKYKDNSTTDWKYMSKHDTKAARDREYERLLESDNIIEG